MSLLAWLNDQKLSDWVQGLGSLSAAAAAVGIALRQERLERRRAAAAGELRAQVLAAAGVLEGRKCSCYPAVSPDVTRAGGIFADVAMTEAVVDGNLVSAPAWPAHPAWLANFLTVLGTRIEP